LLWQDSKIGGAINGVGVAIMTGILRHGVKS
jgi:hypothetical protein